MQRIPSTLKIDFKDDIRRVALLDSSYSSLVKQVGQLFNLQEGTFVIKYKDDEGDLVTLASEMEFKEALSFFQQSILRLSVFDLKKKEEQKEEPKEGCRGKWGRKWGGKCGGNWKKWKCRDQNGEQQQQQQHHGHHHGNHHHQHPFHPFGLINSFRDIANQFIQGGQCDGLLENILNSGFVKLEHNHICDGCNTTISGDRYHCKQCQDFDFCSSCHEQKVKSHDSNHQFDKISALEALKEALKNGEQIDSFFMPGSSNDPVEKIRHNAFCDRCSQNIVGIRWKCLECNDFDFCNNCYLIANGKEDIKAHQKNHPFAKIEDPSSYPQSFFQEKKLYQERLNKEKIQSQLNNTNVSSNINTIPVKEPKVEVTKQEQPKEEQPKEIYPFSKKLDDLSTMGFSDRKKNIQLLIKNKGDIQLTIQDLLNF